MNNADLAETLVSDHEMSKADARKVVDGLLATIALAGSARPTWQVSDLGAGGGG